MDDLAFLDRPAIHPRLLEPDARADLREQWRDGIGVRVDEVLTPGLAAELARFARGLPIATVEVAAEAELSARCEVAVPPRPEPQHPECVYRLVRFLDDDLPALVAAVTGRALVRPRPWSFEVRRLRKGSFVDAGTPPTGVHGCGYALGLTGDRWPPEVGGQLELVDARGAVVARRPPGWDTLDVIDSPRYRLSLVTRPVEAVSICGHLVAAEAAR